MKKIEVVIIMIVISAFLLAFKVYGQTASPAPVTEKEMLDLRTKQLAIFQLAEQRRQMERQYDDASKVAQDDLSKAIAEVYSTRKIKVEDYSLCDGPQAGVCAEAPKGVITWKVNPKAEAKKP